MITFHFMDKSDMANLEENNFNKVWEKAENAFNYLKGLPSSLPLLRDLNTDLTDIKAQAKRYQKFDDVIILGTGGSSLGGQAILALRETETPRIHFLDNIDAYTFDKKIKNLDRKKTGVIAISKSGNTAETLMQLLTCIDLWQGHSLSDHFLIVSENADNAIREIARKYTLPCLDHPKDIGGRFSAFTVVGILPALIAGIDAEALRKGAEETVDMLRASTLQYCGPLIGAALQVAFYRQGINQHVLFVYSDRLRLLSNWFCQLWAESIGKKGPEDKGLGTTPISALGAVDQHSQLQLYLAGPRDKFFTFVTLEDQYPLKALSLEGFDHPAIMSLNGKTMGELMIAEQKATIDTMRNQKCPLRQLQIKKLDATNLGALMMHFILETIAAAHLLQVDPFDQPAVEEGKILALKYLQAA
jgi:glucose-6-phosphate isomerase